MLLFMLLVVAGDVERNPGPQGKELQHVLYGLYIVYHSLRNT